MPRAGDDAERSDAEERRLMPRAGDDAERSDAEERRLMPLAGDDAMQSSHVGAPPTCRREERRR